MSGPSDFMRLLLSVTMLVALLAPGAAHAADTWEAVAPGIDHLTRVLTTPTRQVIHAARVDLSRQEYYVRATRDDEAGKTTTGFSQHVGPEAMVVINGDWGTGSAPWNVQGLAIGRGVRWHDDHDDWSFFACTLDDNSCVMDFSGSASSAAIDPRWFAAVGSNGSVLIEHGAPRYGGSFDPSPGNRNPRSALGLSQDGKTLWMVVVEGRRSQATGVAAPWADGMTFDEVVALMVDLGAYDAVMQDGGGSSALVIAGRRVTRLPANQSTERTVANHLAIVRADGADPECATLKKGRYCTGTQVHTCEGGHHSVGDCGAFGLQCEAVGTWAYCKDSRCPTVSWGGCSGTRIAKCVAGVYSEGDCAAFGLGCGVIAGEATCIDARCRGNPTLSACDGPLLRECTAGAYAERSCADAGLPCVVVSGRASCGDPRCVGLSAAGACRDYFLERCVDGAYSVDDCSDRGGACVEADGGASCEVPVPDSGAPEPPDGGVVVDPGPRGPITGSCACASTHELSWLLVAVSGWSAGVRRRRPLRGVSATST